VYVVRWTDPARIYAISSGGEVVRAFELKAEMDGEKPGAVIAGPGKLAIQFPGSSEDPRSMVHVADLEGRLSGAYDSTGLGVAFACYSESERFTFLTATAGGKIKWNFFEPGQ